MATIERPASDECSEYYLGYANRVPAGDVLTLLSAQLATLGGLLRDLSADQADFRFALGEWSIKEVIGHLVDTERIFSARAFFFSRDETAVMPGIDPDLYVREGNLDARTLPDLLDELTHLRHANLLAYRHFTPEASQRRGVASGSIISVRALIYITACHLNYHLDDLRDKYLPGLAAN
jgi:hypothetical protein